MLREMRSSRRRSWLISTMPARAGGELGFQPFDAGQVQMVGRLVQQQAGPGSGASARTRAARRASPPDRRAGSSSPVRPTCSSKACAR